MASKRIQDTKPFTAKIDYGNGDASAQFHGLRDEDELEEPYALDLTLWPNTEVTVSYSDGRIEKLTL